MEEISHSESREIKKESKVQEKPKDSQKKFVLILLRTASKN